MSFGKTSSSSKPVFFEGQKELGSQAIQDIASRVLGGAPSVSAEAQAQRSQQGVIRQSARAGFSEKDPITQRKLALVEAQRGRSEEQSFAQLLQFLLSPAGQASSSSGFNIGIS